MFSTGRADNSPSQSPNTEASPSSPAHTPTTTIPSQPVNNFAEPEIKEVTVNSEPAASAQSIPLYEKAEIAFDVGTIAKELQFPYNASPPPGITPGTGITVDAHFTPDNRQTVYTQPAFYYQDFDYEIKDGRNWIYPADRFFWKVRFTPTQPGNWQFRLAAQDAGGIYQTEAYAFSVTPSENKGFIKVSRSDPRYFEYDNGTYFTGLGYNRMIEFCRRKISNLAKTLKN